MSKIAKGWEKGWREYLRSIGSEDLSQMGMKRRGRAVGRVVTSAGARGLMQRCVAAGPLCLQMYSRTRRWGGAKEAEGAK